MRLSTIKLAGFKSFADPTHFQLPGQLVGVVGPNGCGKSNIMDAVRWVLGESKASELRGDSMQDVIFNGSNQRKPASRASVELVFDNSDHGASGPWNGYAEIAVKRVLTREGGSSYYINNQLVRRRDVQDVFMGTGLGPRAYAIIGQGTISRIIESRPEELRLFLEEAAGVSKYKERRRETENRLADTHENLTRVQDILQELSANLSHLQHQAELAGQYKNLSNRLSIKHKQLWFLKQQSAQAEADRWQAEGVAAQAELDAQGADLRRIEADLETLRQNHYAAGDALNQAQGQLYATSADVARLETEIRYVVEGRARVAQRLQQIDAQRQTWQAQADAAEHSGQDLQAQQDSAEQNLQALSAQLEWAQDQDPAAEQALQQAQAQLHSQRLVQAQIQAQISAEAAQQRSLDEQRRQIELRMQRLHDAQRQHDAPDPIALAQLQSVHAQAQQTLAQARSTVETASARLPSLDAQRQRLQTDQQAQADRLAQIQARHQALVSLQARLSNDGKLQPWLAQQGLQDLHDLWPQLQVEAGWETALEAVLRERLGAREISRIEHAAGLAVQPPPTRLVFFTAPDPRPPAGTAIATPLLAYVRCAAPGAMAALAHWLTGVFVADDLAHAMRLRERLGPGQCLVVAQGHVVDALSVSFYAPDNERAGLLARAHEIENLAREQRAQALLAEHTRTQWQQIEAAWAQAQADLRQTQSEAQQAQTQLHAAEVAALRAQAAHDQAQAQAQALGDEWAELQARLEDLAVRDEQGLQRLDALDAELAQVQQAVLELEDAHIAAQRTYQAQSETLRRLERDVQEARFSQRSSLQQLAQWARTAQTAQAQLQALAREREQAQAEWAQLSDAAAQDGLQAALGAKLQAEQTLGRLRSHYDELTQQLRALDERRLQSERGMEPARSRVTEAQLKVQAARLGAAQWSQQLLEAEADLAEVARSVTQEGVRLAGLQGEIERLQREISALGPVNLAALDELSAAQARQGFLQSQSDDLQEAVATLEAAIRTIDGETRTLLTATFETVNGHFGRLFPELFGGGQAKLVMTGDEILDTGVQVFAQPPGKKNQTIHLLSGGEKALTAIALVFAMFELNPAPFCLLDEVDAPLDDANTERYARLVAKMGRETQFLFISHNKIAMEMAQQLVGVTMQEQGVSRIVAVDMHAAMQLADLG